MIKSLFSWKTKWMFCSENIHSVMQSTEIGKGTLSQGSIDLFLFTHSINVSHSLKKVGNKSAWWTQKSGSWSVNLCLKYQLRVTAALPQLLCSELKNNNNKKISLFLLRLQCHGNGIYIPMDVYMLHLNKQTSWFLFNFSFCLTAFPLIEHLRWCLDFYIIPNTIVCT